MKVLRRDWLPLAALVFMVVATLYAWGRVPDTLPVHWGVSGEPTRYGGRLEALGVMPLVCALLYALALALPRLAKGPAQNEQLVGAVLRTVVVGLAALHLGLVANHLGAGLAVTQLAGLSVGFILMGTGNLLPKARPSRWVGVRTPWTFGSKESWWRSQRAGGWVLTLSGLAFFVTALFTASGVALFAVVGATLLAVLGLTLYSYLVWRNDPMREPTEPV